MYEFRNSILYIVLVKSLKIDANFYFFLELDKKAIQISRSYKENVLQKLTRK